MPMRQFNLKHGPWPARDCAVPSAPNEQGWAVLPEEGEEQERAAREWLWHLQRSAEIKANDGKADASA